MPAPSVLHHAIVLPGAVARGAYEAGVLQACVERGVQIDRIVATSSGALNGVALAAGIRSGREREVTDALVKMWVEKGSWSDSFNFNPLKWLTGRGLSDQHGLLGLMRDIVRPNTGPKDRDFELRIIVAPLNGVIAATGKIPATTYEKMLEFTGEDFDSEEKLERVFKVVSAACAFPGLFAPVEIPGFGPCVDGGAVNNAPIKYALDESDVDHVFVVVPSPAVIPPPASVSGWSLLNHLIEILINERLFRDLNDARNVNADTDRLDALVSTGQLTREQVDAVSQLLHIRKVKITEIRPRAPLTESPFSGFFKRADRERLVQEGREAAFAALDLV